MSLSVQKLALLALAIISTSSSAESFSAKRAGQGFTAITQGFSSSISNPALLSKYEYDDFYFSLTVGGMSADEYNLIDTANSISDNIDILEYDITNAPIPEPPDYRSGLEDQAGVIVNDLEYADKKLVTTRTGLNLQFIVPNQYLTFGLFTTLYGKMGVIVDYDEGDENILEQGIIDGNLNQSDLQSSVIGVGYAIEENGIILSYQAIKDINYDFNIGTKIKFQRIDLFYNDSKIVDFDDSEFDLTQDEYLTEDSSTNIDLGLYFSFGEQRQWSLALVSNNLIGQEVTHNAKNITFNLDMATTFGLSYQNSWLTLATEIDLSDREYFQQLSPARYASVGAEFSLIDHMKFRLGLRSDLNNNEADIYTIGLGVSPWEAFSLDIAGFTGDRDNLGAAIKLGINI